MPATADVIFFAIQAGVRLYAAGRKAYVDSTKGRELILPLPSGPGIGTQSAVTFFTADPLGAKITSDPANALIRDYLADFDNGTLTQEGKDELLSLYLAFLAEFRTGTYQADTGVAPSEQDVKGTELVAFLTVRQWAEDDPQAPRNPFHTIAGTLVNIAVDYFIQVPGAISERRPEGRALKTFLTAVDEVNFAEQLPATIVGDLMIAVVDSVAANPDLIGNSKTERMLVQNVATSLSKASQVHLANVDTMRQAEASDWLQVIARAVIEGGAQTVLADPSRVLGIGATEGEIVRDIGTVVSKLLLPEARPGQVDFRALLSGDGLNTVVKAGLQAAATHVDIFKIKNDGYEKILVGVAQGLAGKPKVLTADIFPDIAALVLTKTSENLELIWPGNSTDLHDHLLMSATQNLFDALAKGTGNGQWPVLTKDQIIDIADAVFDDVIDHPEWIKDEFKIGDDTALEVAVNAALGALKQFSDNHPNDNFISSEAALATVKATVTAVAWRHELLKPLGAGATKPMVEEVISAVLDATFGTQGTGESRWRRARNSAYVLAVELALKEVSKSGVDDAKIRLLREGLGGLIDKQLSADDFAKELENML